MTRLSGLALAAAIPTIALAALPLAAAEAKAPWELKTANAYFSVYSYYCAPGFYERAASAEPPSSMEIAVYSDAFRVDYGGDCRAFFFGAIAPRISDPRSVVLARQ